MSESLLDLTTRIVGTFISNNSCRPDELPDLIVRVGESLTKLAHFEAELSQGVRRPARLSPAARAKSAIDSNGDGASSDREEETDGSPEAAVAEESNEASTAAAAVNMVSGPIVVGGAPVGPDGRLVPAVPIEESVQDNYLICLEDGRKMKMLRRHLRTRYGMTPEDYRRRWGLDDSYPMVAPNYARLRSRIAQDVGFGRDAGDAAET
jgi:predicted transcriptional regulator